MHTVSIACQVIRECARLWQSHSLLRQEPFASQFRNENAVCANSVANPVAPASGEISNAKIASCFPASSLPDLLFLVFGSKAMKTHQKRQDFHSCQATIMILGKEGKKRFKNMENI